MVITLDYRFLLEFSSIALLNWVFLLIRSLLAWCDQSILRFSIIVVTYSIFLLLLLVLRRWPSRPFPWLEIPERCSLMLTYVLWTVQLRSLQLFIILCLHGRLTSELAWIVKILVAIICVSLGVFEGALNSERLVEAVVKTAFEFPCLLEGSCRIGLAGGVWDGVRYKLGHLIVLGKMLCLASFRIDSFLKLMNVGSLPWDRKLRLWAHWPSVKTIQKISHLHFLHHPLLPLLDLHPSLCHSNDNRGFASSLHSLKATSSCLFGACHRVGSQFCYSSFAFLRLAFLLLCLSSAVNLFDYHEEK